MVRSSVVTYKLGYLKLLNNHSIVVFYLFLRFKIKIKPWFKVKRREEMGGAWLGGTCGDTRL